MIPVGLPEMSHDPSPPPEQFRQSSNGASPMHGPHNRQQPLSASTVPHIATRQYVEQHRAVLDQQRRLHDEERILWDVERRELQQRITELEQIITRLGGTVPLSERPSMSNQNTMLLPHTSTGDEFWRGPGGKEHAQPTRTFSQSSERSLSTATATDTRLPSISEDSQKKSVDFDTGDIVVERQDFTVHPIPAITRERMAATFDGISFKSAPSITSSMHSHSGRQSPLLRSPSSGSSVPPVEPRPKVLNLSSMELHPADLLTKDAGHTPLSRLAETASNASSQATPMKPLLTYEESIPATGRALALGKAQSAPVRPPPERGDSYFPQVLSDGEGLPDIIDDPHLKGPLALSPEPQSQENQAFLSQLDSKLLEVKRFDSTDEASAEREKKDAAFRNDHALRKTESANARLVKDEPGGKNEECEPKLRLKRSVNFGSAFGSRKVGRV